MKIKSIILGVIGALIIMGIFNFFQRKQTPDPIYRVVWFELQIAPASYRFAIMPEQPILIGYEGENGEKGATMLIRYDHVPEVFNRTVEKVNDLVKNCKIFDLPITNPDLAFEDSYMNEPSVHIRLAYANDKRWAGYYPLGDEPDAVSSLIRDTKALAKQLMEEQTNQVIDGDTAHSHLAPDKNTAQKNEPSVVVKVKVHLSGDISANGEKVTLAELDTVLDDLKQENGGVWYFRESPEEEPPESLDQTIEAVLDAITSRSLPVRLQPEEY
jgi:hypothetical protein